jgi:1-aminocyclopropane-1-carboxylate deaminase
MQEFKIRIQQVNSLSAMGIHTDILRLDELHPVVSGNKWFKLNYYIKDALAKGKDTIATFGGAYSNHIVAAAYAAREAGLKSIGYIRGEASAFQPTLEEAAGYGMELRFVDRDSFKQKRRLIQEQHQPGWYWIMEGGYGPIGAKGAADILRMADCSLYSHILCAVGTGTMMAGLIKAAGSGPGQQIIGIPVLRHPAIEKEVTDLLTKSEKTKPFLFLHDYHFGGYAKHPQELIRFMNLTWETDQIPTDIVYTAKLLFAAQDLVSTSYFRPGSRLLLVHSGGLQGNRSLPPGTLTF